MLVGKGGETIKKLRAQLEKMTGKNIQLDISEVMNPETDAQLIAESVAFSLERRVSFRRAMKQAIGRSMRAGVEGIKVMTSGRLGGAEMARTEGYSEGNVPLSTLRADIDYGFAEANTTYGKIGVKVWLNNGEVLPGENGVELKRLQAKKKQDRKPRRGGQRGGAPRGRRNDNRRNNPKNN
jgi:small subunit ribosomal protein S3